MERDRAVLRCEIFPADLDVTVAFYVGVLAFQVMRDERRSTSPYVALRRGAVALGAAARPPISDRGSRRPPVGVELVLEVDDLDADRARVDAAGWPVTEEITQRPRGLRDFRLLDPDGYYWRITAHAACPPGRSAGAESEPSVVRRVPLPDDGADRCRPMGGPRWLVRQRQAASAKGLPPAAAGTS